MSEQPGTTQGRNEAQATVKRRSLAAGAAALVAGFALKQAAQPVAAAYGLQAETDNQVAATTSLTAKSNLSGTAVLVADARPSGNPAAGATGFGAGPGAGISGTGGNNGGPGVFGVGGAQDAGAANGAGVVGLAVNATTGVSGANSDSGLDVGVLGSGFGVNRTGVKGVSDGSGIGVVGIGQANPNGGTTYQTAGVGVSGSGDKIGVQGIAQNGIGGAFVGFQAQMQLVPPLAGSAGPPTGGSHGAGEFYVDKFGQLFYFTGSAWIHLSAQTVSPLVLLPNPERFVDTRSGLGGLQGPVPSGTTHAFPMTGRTGQSGNPALIIPDAATAIVGNLTAIGAAGIPPGSYITLWPGGPIPTVSNVNYGPGAVVANSFVVGLTAAGGHGTVSVYNLSACDYILDVTGYYTSAASASSAKKQ